jgi:hypothetical protein
VNGLSNNELWDHVQEITHPFGHDDIEFLIREPDLFELTLHECDCCGEVSMETLGEWYYLLSLNPFASIIFCAWSIILDMSTCELLESAARFSPEE